MGLDGARWRRRWNEKMIASWKFKKGVLDPKTAAFATWRRIWRGKTH